MQSVVLCYHASSDIDDVVETSTKIQSVRDILRSTDLDVRIRASLLNTSLRTRAYKVAIYGEPEPIQTAIDHFLESLGLPNQVHHKKKIAKPIIEKHGGRFKRGLAYLLDGDVRGK